MIIHWRKNTDYLVVRLYQDLVGDWIISEQRGRYLSSVNQVSTQRVYPTYKEARSTLLLLNKQYRQLGFKISDISEEQLGFRFE